MSQGVTPFVCQEFPKAREHYERFLELCKLLGDTEGEAVGYNFLGCNIQESQDLKLACQRNQIVLVQGAPIVDTQVQIEVRIFKILNIILFSSKGTWYLISPH